MKSFRDHETGVLKAWGYAESNGSDIARDEPDGFSLAPGKWQFVDENWIPVAPDPNAEILAQIAQIEAATMVPRVVRESLLAFAEDMAQREAERLTAEGTPTTADQLLTENVGYVRTKAVDDQIRQLRSQLT